MKKKLPETVGVLQKATTDDQGEDDGSSP